MLKFCKTIVPGLASKAPIRLVQPVLHATRAFAVLVSIAQNAALLQMVSAFLAATYQVKLFSHHQEALSTKITAPGLVSQDTFRAIRRVSGAAHHYALLVSTGPRAARQPTERVSHAQWSRSIPLSRHRGYLMTRITALGHVSQATIRAVLHVLRAAHPFVRLDSTEHLAPWRQTAVALHAVFCRPMPFLHLVDNLTTRIIVLGRVRRAILWVEWLALLAMDLSVPLVITDQNAPRQPMECALGVPFFHRTHSLLLVVFHMTRIIVNGLVNRASFVMVSCA